MREQPRSHPPSRNDLSPRASAERLTDTVGGTPLVDISELGVPGVGLFAKLESRNPSGSVKDRVAVAMVEDAERNGRLRPGMTLVEATGGNTGIALAVLAAERGYPLILTMPDAMSTERVALLRHLGAQIVLTSGILMSDAKVAAKQIAAGRSGPAVPRSIHQPVQRRGARTYHRPGDLAGHRWMR